MIRRLGRLNATLLWVGLAAMLAAGCGGTTPTQTSPQTGSHAPTISAHPNVTPSASSSRPPTVSASPGPTYLAHLDAALEDQLPSVIGGVTLTKFSYPVSTYLASIKGGDSVLYPSWLVKFGKTPDAVDMAFAEDDLPPVHVNLRAIQVPGADPTALVAGLADVATKAGWPNRAVTSLSRPVLQITDPTADPTKTANEAFVYAKGDVVFFLISDNINIVIEALSKLP
jgi:hypothetical protein